MKKKRRAPRPSPIEHLIIDRRWRAVLTSAYIHTLVGDDVVNQINLAGRVLWVITGVAEARGYAREHTDMVTLADACEALQLQSQHRAEVVPELRERLCAGLAVCERLADVFPTDQMVAEALRLEAMLRDPEPHVRAFRSAL